MAELTRERADGAAQVDNAELFYDLVFVFAVTQLSHALIAHPTPGGALRTGILFAGLWWAWINTSWVTNWLDPARIRVRLLLFVLMAAGLVAAIAVPDAWGRRGLVFAGAYAVLEVGRSLFMLVAVRHDGGESYDNYRRILVWHALAAVLWLVGGIGDPGPRTAWWGAALAVATLGPALYFRVPGLGRSSVGNWDVDGHHLSERCGLFVIIALGESILVTGTTFGAVAWNWRTAAAFSAAFGSTLAMWWLYFNVGAGRGHRRITDDDEPGRLARTAYTYAHMPIIAGVIVGAAADEMVLTHPLDHGDPASTVIVLGGPALYLAGNALFKRLTVDVWPRSHMAGLALLAPLAIASPRLTPLALGVGGALALGIAAGWETWVYRGRREKTGIVPA